MITKAYVVTEEQAEFLEALAEQQDRSVSWIVRQIFDREMSRQTEGERDESINEAQ